MQDKEVKRWNYVDENSSKFDTRSNTHNKVRVHARETIQVEKVSTYYLSIRNQRSQ